VGGRGGFEEEVKDGCGRMTDEAAAAPSKRRRSQKRDKATKQQRRPSVHTNQPEYSGGRRETETVAATLVATVRGGGGVHRCG
jgi:hypothetical protein